jgi:hypothetical protein
MLEHSGDLPKGALSEMSRTSWLGALLTTALCCCAFAATNADASVLFLWSGSTPSLFLSVGDDPQLFETEKVDIECIALNLDGTITSKRFTGIRARGSFRGCSTTAGVVITVPSETEFEWTASEGLKVRDFIEFEVKGEVTCTVDFLPEIGAERKTVKYTDTSLDVLASANVIGLEYIIRGGGGTCGSTEGTHVDGKYRGLVQLSSTELGGAFGWDL